MSRPTGGRSPKYRLHKPSGQAVVTVRLPGGGRRDIYLGRYDSPESWQEYARVKAELAAAGPPGGSGPLARSDATVAEVLLAFWGHATEHFRRPDGTTTKELEEYRSALRVVRELYAPTRAAEFGPLALQAVRRAMVAAGWCRTRVNKQVGRVRRAFKWAAAQELVPAAVPVALGTVDGLRRGRTDAAERAPVAPAPAADVDKVVAVLPPTLRTMVLLQRLTGMRPGEVRTLRPCDVDRSGPVWRYAPPAHKMAHAGRPRVVMLGPKAQDALAPFLAGVGPDEFVFRPAQAREEWYALRRAARKSKVTPSQVCRRKPAAELTRGPRSRYTDFGYAQAVARGCRRAGVPELAPNRIRHLFATEVRARFGLEAAQVLLGHAKADVTQVYAQRNADLAARVAAEIG